MKKDSTMNRLRAANPMLAKNTKDEEELFASIVAQPGDRRLNSSKPRKALRRRTRMVLVAGALIMGSFTAVAATYPELINTLFPGNPFTANDGAIEVWKKSEEAVRNAGQRPGAVVGQPGKQTVDESTVGSLPFHIPGLGKFTFWHAQTEEKGWCGALKSPTGQWLVNSIERPEHNMACRPARDPDGPIMNTGLNYSWDYSFDWEYDETSGLSEWAANTPKSGHWIVVSGFVSGKRPASRVKDRFTGVSVPVKDGRWFAIAVPYTDGETRGEEEGDAGREQWHLTAYDRDGKVVANDGKELAGLTE